MKKTLLLVIAALMVPSVALAAKPAHGPKHGPSRRTGDVRAQGHTLELHGVRRRDEHERHDHDRRQLREPPREGPQGSDPDVRRRCEHDDRAQERSHDDHERRLRDGSRSARPPRSRPPISPRPCRRRRRPRSSTAASSRQPDGDVRPRGGTLSALHGVRHRVTPANGTVSILVKHAAAACEVARRDMTLVFAIDANTKVSLGHKLTTITDGDKGARSWSAQPSGSLTGGSRRDSRRRRLRSGSSIRARSTSTNAFQTGGR